MSAKPMTASESQGKVDFGYQDVSPDEKTRRVGRVFDSVADRYDLMNDLMSAGMHRGWKRYFVATAGIRPGHCVLDLASGTGDVARLLAAKVGADGAVIASDINRSMLSRGRDRSLDKGNIGNIEYCQANAEMLPWFERSFDAVTIAFGLRNVTDKAVALREMHRVLKPGGSVQILEFSHFKSSALQPAYDFYSFQILPRLGKLVTGDADSYRYLAESIRKHPDQDTLKAMMESAGFERVTCRNLAGGIVAIHGGYRL